MRREIFSQATGQRELVWCAPLAGITLLAFACAEWMAAGTQVSASEIVLQYSRATVLLGLVALFCSIAALAIVFALRRERSPIRAIGRVVRVQIGSAHGLASTFGIGCTVVLMGSFGAMKMLMPLHRAFTWDDRLAVADRTLFFGWEPWELTHALLAGAVATRAIDWMYTLWVPLLFLAVIVAACARPAARAQFLLSFGAAWLLLGVMGAYAFASAGPCYSASIGAAAAPEFQPLMERLRLIGFESKPLNAVIWQSTLWNAHVTRSYSFAMGISAMPSMHNAIAMLYALSLWNARPLYRYGSRVFAVFVLIASVHLGWHYAVDGFAAWLGMAAIWAAAGLYLRKLGYIDLKGHNAAAPIGQPSGATALA